MEHIPHSSDHWLVSNGGGCEMNPSNAATGLFPEFMQGTILGDLHSAPCRLPSSACQKVPPSTLRDIPVSRRPAALSRAEAAVSVPPGAHAQR